MPIRLYVDHNVHGPTVRQLEARGIDVLTVESDGRADEKNDAALLDRAAELGRAVFSTDDDFLKEARRRDWAGEAYVPVFYAHQLRATVGEIVNDLEVFCTLGELDDPGLADRVIRIPTKRERFT